MRIRKYRVGDETKVRSLISGVLGDMYGSVDIKWEDFCAYDGFFVDEKDGDIVGCAAVKKVDGKVANLRRMYVRKDFQKNGVGNKLMKKCFEFCNKKGFRKVFLTTYPEMESAINFYERNGFVRIENAAEDLFPTSMLKGYKGKRIAMERVL